jgi:septal ring factor EnvC (AmiA/AmiB activator)
MVGLSIKQASEETGKDRTTLLRAIQKGTITAKKDNNNSWTIEPSELFRVYERILCTQGQNTHDATSVHTPNADLAQGKNDARTGQNNRIITQTDIELAQATTAREFLERQITEQQERIKLLETIVSDLKQDKEIYRNQIKAITDQRQPQPAPEPVKTVRKKILGIF